MVGECARKCAYVCLILGAPIVVLIIIRFLVLDSLFVLFDYFCTLYPMLAIPVFIVAACVVSVVCHNLFIVFIIYIILVIIIALIRRYSGTKGEENTDTAHPKKSIARLQNTASLKKRVAEILEILEQRAEEEHPETE
jgi:hypothetical protein